MRKCPHCKQRSLVRIHAMPNDDKEYQLLTFECKDCLEKSKIMEMSGERGKELLNYEKAYWKMKDLLDKFY